MSRVFTCLFAVLAISSTQAQQWDTLATIPEKLTFPVVVTLNGKIHIMGGGGAGGATNSHYQYDPASNTWSPKADVPYLAQQPAGSVLGGKIHYLGGGYPNSGSRLNDHWVYDPSNNSWSEADTIPIPRAIHEAACVNDQLYVMSGQPDKARCESYNPLDSIWTQRNNLPDQNFWYAAITEHDGKIYRFGGGGYTAPTNKASIYNPTNDLWSNLPNLPMANHAPDAAAIGDTIFISGGYFDFADADLVLGYDIVNQTYDTLTPLPVGRSYHSMVSIDTCLYVLGGNNAIDDEVGTSMIRICLSQLYPKTDTNDSNTLVSEINFSNHIRIYSPDGKRLFIEPKSPFIDSELNLQVFDLLGREVYATTFYGTFSSELTFDLPKSGIYLVNVKGSNIHETQKIWLRD